MSRKRPSKQVLLESRVLLIHPEKGHLSISLHESLCMNFDTFCTKLKRSIVRACPRIEMKKMTRYEWNTSHDCHVCGVKAQHCCPTTCTRSGLRRGKSRRRIKRTDRLASHWKKCGSLLDKNVRA